MKIKNINSHIGWIDIAKGILIALIVLGHVISDGNNILQTWIYSFHVVGFFIINGYLKSETHYLNRVLNIKEVFNKQKSIYLLYLIFSIIFICRIMIQAGLGMYSGHELGVFILHIITLNGEGVLWFLPVFAISEIIFYFVMKYKKIIFKVYILAVLAAIFIAKSFPFNDVLKTENILLLLVILYIRCLIASSLFMIGYVICENNIFDTKWMLLGVLSVFSFINGNVDLNNLRFGNFILYYVFGIIGTFFIVMLSKIIETYSRYLKSVLTCWGENSIIIMLTHAIFLIYQLISIVIKRYLLDNIVAIPIIFLLTMCVEYILIRIWEKLRKILLRKRKK